MSIDFGEHRDYEEPRIPPVIMQRLRRYADRFRELYINVAFRENPKKHGAIKIGNEAPRTQIFSGEILAMRAGFESTRDFCYRWDDLDQEVLLSIKESEDMWKLLQRMPSAEPL